MSWIITRIGNNFYKDLSGHHTAWDQNSQLRDLHPKGTHTHTPIQCQDAKIVLQTT